MARCAGNRGPPAPPRRAALLFALLTVLLLELVVPPGRRAAAQNPAPADVVAAAADAYGTVGTLAVVLAKQQRPVAASSIAAAEARSARITAYGADNGLADRPFPAASMAKLFVAEDILRRSRAGLLSLTRVDFALLQAMIRHSDDPAASTLWVRFGGGRMVSDVAARYGLSGTAPPVPAGQWGQTVTTGRDLARFLSLLPVVAHPSDAGALQVWMRTATPLAADGFDQRFGLFGTVPGLPAVKQGWMCCVGGNRHLHSVGVVGSRVVVLLSEVHRSVGYAAARTALDAAAAALPPPRP
jgi:hypothetical protein